MASVEGDGNTAAAAAAVAVQAMHHAPENISYSSTTSDSTALQNSSSLRSRTNVKGKHLIRSQALRESTSPPRAPTISSSSSNGGGGTTNPTSPSISANVTAAITTNSTTHTISTKNIPTINNTCAISATVAADPIPPIVIACDDDGDHGDDDYNSNSNNVDDCPLITPNPLTAAVTSSSGRGTHSVTSAVATARPTTPTTSALNASSSGIGSLSAKHSTTPHHQHRPEHSRTVYDSPAAVATPTFLDQEFPKLTHPKSRGSRTSTSPSYKSSASAERKHNLLEVQYIVGNSAKVPLGSTKARSSSSDLDGGHCCAPDGSGSAECPGCCKSDEIPGVGNARQERKKNRHFAMNGGGGLFAKGSKPRLKSMGSSASTDEANSSGFLSRDDSLDQYTDANGVDLLQFFKDTINKNTKDRNMLIKIEKDLQAFALDHTKTTLKFPIMSSYNRMLIHRVAAFFGMDHNVDASQQSVIVSTTKATRVPDVQFQNLFRENEPRKSILKRETHSFDEYRRGLQRCNDGNHSDYLDCGPMARKAKSFEERDEDYDHVTLHSFKKRGGQQNARDGHHEPTAGGGRSNGGSGAGDACWPIWGISEGSVHEQPLRRSALNLKSSRLLKMQSLSVETKSEGRPPISKSYSFGGYGPASAVHKGHGPHGSSRIFSKHDSITTSWRLSPSSSGYKTQTQSIRSDSVTPSPTGYESGGEQTPEPAGAARSTATSSSSGARACGVVWAVTDMAAVPPGSVLIDPQTLQPIINQDGSIYHFDPDNLPAGCQTHNHNVDLNAMETGAEATECCNLIAQVRQNCDKYAADEIDAEGVDEECIENGPPAMLYPNDMYATASDERMLESASEPHIHELDERYDSSSEIAKLEQKTSEMSIANTSEMQIENLSVIPEDEQTPHTEIDPTTAVVAYSERSPVDSIHHYTPAYPLEKPIGVPYYTYPAAADAEIARGTILVPVYNQAVDVQHEAAPTSAHVFHNHPQHIHGSGSMTLANHNNAAGNSATVHNTGSSANTMATTAATILPLAYPPAMFHGTPPTGAVHAQHMQTAPPSAQLIYAPATALDGQPGAQYITIPMGYPYAYHDPAYANYWPNPMTTYYVPQGITAMATTETVTATYHPNTPYAMHPHLVAASANATAYSATANKRGSPNNSQQHQPHHHHHHSNINSSNNHNHNQNNHQHQHQSHHQFTATTFNGSISLAAPPPPNHTAVQPYANNATRTSSPAQTTDAAAYIKSAYPIIPQAICTNYAPPTAAMPYSHQQPTQYNQLPPSTSSSHQYQPPSAQRALASSTSSSTPATTALKASAAAATTSGAGTPTAIALQSPPPQSITPNSSSPHSTTSDLLNNGNQNTRTASNTTSSNSSPTQAAVSPTSTSSYIARNATVPSTTNHNESSATPKPIALHRQHNNAAVSTTSSPPNEFTAVYKPSPSNVNTNIGGQHHSSVARSASSEQRTTYSPPNGQHSISGVGGGVIRKATSTSYFSNGSGNGYSQHSGPSNSAMVYASQTVAAHRNNGSNNASMSRSQSTEQFTAATAAMAYTSNSNSNATHYHHAHSQQLQNAAQSQTFNSSSYSNNSNPLKMHMHKRSASQDGAGAAVGAAYVPPQGPPQQLGHNHSTSHYYHAPASGATASFRNHPQNVSNHNYHSLGHPSNGGKSNYNNAVTDADGEYVYPRPRVSKPYLGKNYMPNFHHPNSQAYAANLAAASRSSASTNALSAQPPPPLPPLPTASQTAATSTTTASMSYNQSTRSSLVTASPPPGDNGIGGNSISGLHDGRPQQQQQLPTAASYSNRSVTSFVAGTSDPVIAATINDATPPAITNISTSASSSSTSAIAVVSPQQQASQPMHPWQNGSGTATTSPSNATDVAATTAAALAAANYAVVNQQQQQQQQQQHHHTQHHHQPHHHHHQHHHHHPHHHSTAAASAAAGMYVKLAGQAFFAHHHPSLAFANQQHHSTHHHHQQQQQQQQQQQHAYHQHHQRTKLYASAKDVRTAPPHLGHHHLSDVLPSMNMVLTATRLMNPRATHHNMTSRNPRPPR